MTIGPLNFFRLGNVAASSAFLSFNSAMSSSIAWIALCVGVTFSILEYLHQNLGCPESVYNLFVTYFFIKHILTLHFYFDGFLKQKTRPEYDRVFFVLPI